MKKVIPFTKKIAFNTMIREVTDISINHTLSLNDNNELDGEILVDGKYKMTEASINQEEFHYKLPCLITIDSKYDTTGLEVSISDFNFEIINEEDLKINVDLLLDNLTTKELVRNVEKIPVEIDEIVEEVAYEEPIEKLDKEIDKVLEKNNSEENISSLFTSITSDETFSTYHVYIVRENDTLESIIDKYKVGREELEKYNDLDDLRIGTKLIIPCVNE